MRKTLETPFRILAKPKEKYICRLQISICNLQMAVFSLQIYIFSLQMENDSHSANFSRLLSTLFDGTFRLFVLEDVSAHVFQRRAGKLRRRALAYALVGSLGLRAG